MNEDLRWLAENRDKWPESVKSCDVDKSRGAVSWRGDKKGSITRAQWQAARDELSGKPNWDDVVGEWIAQDEDGHWYSFDSQPHRSIRSWQGIPWYRAGSGRGKVLGDWLQTLERRPENHSVEPTEKVWRGPEDGLPPVGSVLEAWFDDGRCCWHKAHVVGYHPSEANTLAVSLIGDQESRLIWSDTSGIRPILSEEDKAVDEMMESGAIGAFFGAGGGAINDAAFQALFKHMVRHGYCKQEIK